jgi:hypothetical protein
MKLAARICKHCGKPGGCFSQIYQGADGNMKGGYFHPNCLKPYLRKIERGQRIRTAIYNAKVE